jgi:hypothetical protein
MVVTARKREQRLPTTTGDERERDPSTAADSTVSTTSCDPMPGQPPRRTTFRCDAIRRLPTLSNNTTIRAGSFELN